MSRLVCAFVVLKLNEDRFSRVEEDSVPSDLAHHRSNSGKHSNLQLKHLANLSYLPTKRQNILWTSIKSRNIKKILPFFTSSIFSLKISLNMFPPFDCACSLLQENNENSTHHSQRLSDKGTMDPNFAE